MVFHLLLIKPTIYLSNTKAFKNIKNKLKISKLLHNCAQNFEQNISNI